MFWGANEDSFEWMGIAESVDLRGRAGYDARDAGACLERPCQSEAWTGGGAESLACHWLGMANELAAANK